MTASEALARAQATVDRNLYTLAREESGDLLAGAPGWIGYLSKSSVLEQALRALGFAIVPVEADEAMIERGMDEIANTAADCGMKLLCKIERRQCGCRQAAEDAYAAMVAPEKGR